jgi:hypothetical protein
VLPTEIRTQPSTAQRRRVNDSVAGLAFGLGWIPGVGAIYNGEYLKAFIHVVILRISDLGLSIEAMWAVLNLCSVSLTTAFYFLYATGSIPHCKAQRVIVASGPSSGREQHSAEETLWTGSLLIFLGCLLFLNEFINGFIEPNFSGSGR